MTMDDMVSPDQAKQLHGFQDFDSDKTVVWHSLAVTVTLIYVSCLRKGVLRIIA